MSGKRNDRDDALRKAFSHGSNMVNTKVASNQIRKRQIMALRGPDGGSYGARSQQKMVGSCLRAGDAVATLGLATLGVSVVVLECADIIIWQEGLEVSRNRFARVRIRVDARRCRPQRRIPTVRDRLRPRLRLQHSHAQGRPPPAVATPDDDSNIITQRIHNTKLDEENKARVYTQSYSYSYRTLSKI